MKRFCAFALIVLLCCTFVLNDGYAAAVLGGGAVKHITASSAGVDVLVGTYADVVFTCVPDKIYYDKKISLVNENGVELQKFNDEGLNGDKIAGDGIFSTTVRLGNNSRKLVEYSALASSGEKMESYDINFYKELTETDYAVHSAMWERIGELESEMEHMGKTDAEIADAVYAYLITNEHAEIVTRESETSIGFITDAGIPSLFLRRQSDDSGELYTISGDIPEITELPDSAETRGELTTWRNPNVLLVRPYRNDPDEPGFDNERYRNMATSLANTTGGTLTVLDDGDTCPAMLRDNFYKNGFVMVDSHGIDYYNRSYICIAEGEGYNSADLTSRRIITISPDELGITGDYFEVYYAESNTRFENTFFYFGICLGVKFPSLYQPLLGLGASTVIGYDESVSFGYDAMMMVSLFQHMITTCTNDSSRTYTAAEAVQYAKDVNGAVDVYNDTAVMHLYGNGEFAVRKPPVPASSVLLESYVEMAAGSTYYTVPTVLPDNACGYKEEWTSSDPSILEIASPRVLRGLKEGTVTVTCRVFGTDSEGDEYSVSSSMEVEVEFVHITGISANIPSAMMTGGTSQSIIINITPANASDKTVEFTSNNPIVATVDANGTVFAGTPGTAKVLCVTKDGGLECTIDITVRKTTMFIRADEPKDGESYALVYGKNVMLGTIDNGYLASNEVIPGEKYLVGNVPSDGIWSFENTTDGFYIKNDTWQKYISDMSDGGVILTDTPVSKFVWEGNLLKLVNPKDSEAAYLRHRYNYGFAFGRESIAVAFDIFEWNNFSDVSQFFTVSFTDYDSDVIATQVIKMNGKAIPVIPRERAGYTFLGWDICLAGINENVTANAMYREGTTDLCVVTFMDRDGTILKTVEVNEGESVTPPEPPEHGGFTFSGWSEQLSDIRYSMTVFAMYTSSIQGDANLDGKVNTGDAALILQYVAGINELSEEQFAAADYNEDGNVNTGDAAAILKSMLV